MTEKIVTNKIKISQNIKKNVVVIFLARLTIVLLNHISIYIKAIYIYIVFL